MHISTSQGFPQESRTYPHHMQPGPMEQPRKGCGCCGCPGCLMGCLVFLIIVPMIVAALVFMSGGVGENVDRVAISIYQNYGRKAILESPGFKGNPEDKRQFVTLIDYYIASYQKLPPERRHLIRKELLTAAYYEMQNQTPPPDKVRNLEAFIDEVVNRLQKSLPP